MFARVGRYVGQLVTGAGSLYLLQQAHEYKKLQEKMEQMQTTHDETSSIVDAEEKNWLILGRQSPGYVRDTDKTPKKHVHEKISSNPLWIKQLGTQLDNEKHYDLFVGSDFIVERFSKKSKTPKVRVQPDKMLSDDLDTIKDDELFEVGFARKQGFADITQKSPFFHSSIALRKIDTHEPLDSDFVVLSGKEIREVIARTNKTICDPQSCDLYSSNCYSASTYAGGEIISVIHERGDKTEGTQKDIQAVADVLAKRALDNFARGVSNNPVVTVQLTSRVPQILEKHGLGKVHEVSESNEPKM